MDNFGIEISPKDTLNFELKSSSKIASGLVILRNLSDQEISYKVKTNAIKFNVKISPGSKGFLEPNSTASLTLSFDPGNFDHRPLYTVIYALT